MTLCFHVPRKFHLEPSISCVIVSYFLIALTKFHRKIVPEKTVRRDASETGIPPIDSVPIKVFNPANRATLVASENDKSCSL